jgi:arylsulfatase A-like enzyme
MHVPGILRVPGHIKPGQVWDRPMLSMDILPTLLTLADPTYQPTEHIDGRDILPVLNGKAQPHEDLFWSFENERAVRSGDWKLILNPRRYPGDPEPGKVWLSNLEADPTEKSNLAGQHPDRVKALTEKIRAWERDVHLEPE